MAHYGVFTIRDYSNETSTIKFYNDAITLASIAGYLTEFGNMRTAITGLTAGVVANEMWVGDNTLLSQNAPATPIAQRELKWLVTYEGSITGKLYQLTIPCADLSNAALFIANSDDADLTAPEWQAFITAFQAVGATPDNPAENVIVKSARIVGRNL